MTPELGDRNLIEGLMWNGREWVVDDFSLLNQILTELKEIKLLILRQRPEEY